MMVTAGTDESRSDEGQERRQRQEGLRQRKVWQVKYDKNHEYSKNNEYGKGSEKGKEKGKKGKGKGQGREASDKFEFPGHCRSCGK